LLLRLILIVSNSALWPRTLVYWLYYYMLVESEALVKIIHRTLVKINFCFVSVRIKIVQCQDTHSIMQDHTDRKLSMFIVLLPFTVNTFRLSIWSHWWSWIRNLCKWDILALQPPHSRTICSLEKSCLSVWDDATNWENNTNFLITRYLRRENYTHLLIYHFFVDAECWYFQS
jgi:hypothetical protein